MKIAYISSALVPSRTANSINVMKMCQSFSKKGHQVKLFLPLYKDYNSVDDIYNYYGVDKCFDIKWIPVKKNSKLSFRLYGLKALFYAKKWKVDLLYARSLLPVIMLASFSTKVMYELHQPFPKKSSSLILKKITKRKFNKLVVISEALAQHCVKKYNIDRAKIIVAHDGADKPLQYKKADLAYSTPSIKLKVGYVGHLYPGKGMEIISSLVKRCKWADFHVVGGEEKDINIWKNELNNEKNVWFHGYLPHEQTERYRLAFDVLIAPYQRNVSIAGDKNKDIGQWMSPLKLFEYMASEKPIITSDLPVLKEILKDKENALLCTPENIEEWVLSLQWLSKDENARKKISKNAYEEFIYKYTWEARAAKILSN